MEDESSTRNKEQNIKSYWKNNEVEIYNFGDLERQIERVMNKRNKKNLRLPGEAKKMLATPYIVLCTAD